MLSKKNISLVLFEASIVGLCLIVLILLMEQFIENKFLLLFVTGFLFHIIFEYTGLNLWYSIEYCKLV